VGGERRDIFAAAAQGGELDLDGVEAEEEVFAKAAGGGFGVEVGVGGGDHADVDLAGGAGFEDAEELGLLADGDVGDLIEKEGAAVGQFEASDAVGAGVGEGAFDVAEELGLEGAFGECPRIHSD
jgi:hypothetical protein